VAISHELCETAGDAGCNLWADGSDGSEYAHELCDAVEAQSYTLDDVALSNFVLPSFFVAGSAGPYDFMSAAALPGAVGPAKPLATASGGYQIVRLAGTGEHQVQAMVRPDTFTHGSRFMRRVEKRRHALSRKSRRGLHT